MAFHPYLYFGGNCREAFTRYQEIFGNCCRDPWEAVTGPDQGQGEGKT